MSHEELDERSVNWWAHHELSSFWEMVKDHLLEGDYKDHKDPIHKQFWLDYIQCEQDQIEEGNQLTESQVEQVYQRMLEIDWGPHLGHWSQMRFAEVEAHRNLYLAAADFRYILSWLQSGNPNYLRENYLNSIETKVLVAFKEYLRVGQFEDPLRAIMDELIDFFHLALPKG